jgi:hypothetical protein
VKRNVAAQCMVLLFIIEINGIYTYYSQYQ